MSARSRKAGSMIEVMFDVARTRTFGCLRLKVEKQTRLIMSVKIIEIRHELPLDEVELSQQGIDDPDGLRGLVGRHELPRTRQTLDLAPSGKTKTTSETRR